MSRRAFFPNPTLTFSMRASIPKALLAVVPHLQSAVLLSIRITMGWGFFLTGKGKLMNLEKTTRFFDSLHLPLPKFQAMLAGSTEMFGGLLLLVGLGTRFISAPLAFTMVVAYLTAHREDAFLSLSDFTDQAPFPFLMAALVTMAFGAGCVSLDRLLKPWFDKRFLSNSLSS
jgi:putative oxidoreductase